MLNIAVFVVRRFDDPSAKPVLSVWAYFSVAADKVYSSVARIAYLPLTTGFMHLQVTYHRYIIMKPR